MAKGKKPESIEKVELQTLSKDGKLEESREVRWRETGKSIKYFVGNSKSVEAPEMANPAKVISRLNHQVVLCYDGEGMVIPPNGRKLIADYNKLGPLPRGITVLPLKK